MLLDLRYSHAQSKLRTGLYCTMEKCTYEVNPHEWYDLESLQQYPEVRKECISLLNSEWPGCDSERLCSHDGSDDALPVSLVLSELSECRQSCYLVGHSRLVKVVSPPNSVLVESVVVSKDWRGCGVGRILMKLTETCCKKMGYDTVYLVATDGSESFYSHLGYTACSSVETIGAQMLNTCTMQTNDGSACHSSEASSSSTVCRSSEVEDNGDSAEKDGEKDSEKDGEKDSALPQATALKQTTCQLWMKKEIGDLPT